MPNTINVRQNEIRRNQNDLLYAGVKFSAFGTFGAALVVTYTFGAVSGHNNALAWLSLIVVAYAIRLYDLLAYNRRTDKNDSSSQWKIRLSAGALLSSIAWASSLWIIYPENNPAYEALLILALGGVAGGALATLPYDKKLNNAFQLILFLSVQTRLFVDASDYAASLSVVSFFVFGFLLVCGKEVGKNYIDLLSLRYDSQETNITLMKTTEEMAKVGYWQWGIGEKSLEASEMLSSITGLNSGITSITDCYKLIHPADRPSVKNSIMKALHSDDDCTVEFRAKNRRTQEYRNINQVVKRIIDSHNNTILIGTVQDVTAIKQAEERIYNLAFYDPLTSLRNRASFHDYLKFSVDLASKQQSSLAVIYMDLDEFKSINDSYGHECGDALLREFSEHLQRSVRKTDVVARLGGDEFIILIDNLSSESDVIATVERCLSFLKQTITIGSYKINPKISSGVSMYPQDGRDPDTLIKNATIATDYIKKSKPLVKYAFYSEQMTSDLVERVRLEADLRHALKSDQFELWYQPKINVNKNHMTGVEALIRWRHPIKGLVPPGLFIETAERIGMISDIGAWVMRTACRQQAIWRRSGLPLQVAINISGEHFTAPDFVSDVKAVLKEFDVQPNDLEIEITESLSRNPEEQNVVCRELRKIGVKIAIDDFGTGYSSLSVLGEMEFDTIKIDRSFIIGLPDNINSQLMVKTIVGLSAAMGCDIIAEGVETSEQLGYLMDIDCPNIQGYYFSKPVEVMNIPKLTQLEWMGQRAA